MPERQDDSWIYRCTGCKAFGEPRLLLEDARSLWNHHCGKDHRTVREPFWKLLFEDIKTAGCSNTEAVKEIGGEWETDRRYIRGEVEPRYFKGASILALHTRHCGATLTLKRLADVSCETVPLHLNLADATP